MKKLSFSVKHRAGLLLDQLSALPELQPVPGEEGLTAQFSLVSRDDVVVLVVPDDADEKAIQTVIDAHDPDAPEAPPPPTRDDKIAALFDQGIAEVEGATTIAGIRAAHSKLLRGLKPLFMRGT